MSIKEKIEELDAILLKLQAENYQLRQDLNAYADQDLNQIDRDKAAEIVNGIQNKVAEMAPIIQWVANRYQLCVNITNNHHEFIEMLKRNIKSPEAQA